ncbi:MAG: alpha-ketoacid dehydrogenase subunit beta [Armatimonadetes bacterium]|nr:alpha-ketoacid dehydrogenase subunit beta [Armatimonadota bacterium]
MPEITYIQAVREALEEELRRDEKVFLLGEDIGATGGVFGATRGLIDKFGPKRVRQTPISEAAIIGAACGASMLGLRPVAEIMYFDFIAVAMDQVISQVGKMRYMSNGQLQLPLVIRTQGGGGRGKGPQHSSSIEAWFFHSPGMKIVMPATPFDVKGLLKSAIRDDAPVLFIENAMMYNNKGQVPDEEYTVPIGEADIKRVGTDVTIVATGYMVLKSLEAARELEKMGISAEVIDPRTIYPLDIDPIVASVQKTGRLMVVHEAFTRGGIGAEIASQIMEKAFDYLDAPVERLGGLEVPMPYARSLEEVVIPNTDRIIAGANKLCNR